MRRKRLLPESIVPVPAGCFESFFPRHKKHRAATHRRSGHCGVSESQGNNFVRYADSQPAIM
jgi:hypothetical protein